MKFLRANAAHRTQPWWDTEGSRPGMTTQGLEPPSTSTSCSRLSSREKKDKVAPSQQTDIWQQFEADVCNLTQAIFKGGSISRLHIMTTTIVSYASERFGYAEKDKLVTSYTKNRRVTQIKQLWQELQTVRQQHKSATEAQTEGERENLEKNSLHH